MVRKNMRPTITMHVDTVSTDSYAISITLLLHIDSILPIPRISAGNKADSLQEVNTFFFK